MLPANWDTIYLPPLKVPESMPWFSSISTSSQPFLVAGMGYGLPGFSAHNYIRSDVVRADEACPLESSTVTPTPDEKVYRVSFTEVNEHYVVNSSLPPPPPRRSYTNEVTLDVVSFGSFGLTTTTTNDPDGDPVAASGFSPWAVSGTREERPPHSWTTGDVTTYCQDGEIVRSEEINLDWLKGKVDGVFATKGAAIETAFNLGNNIGFGGLYQGYSLQTESQMRGGFYSTAKIASCSESYTVGTDGELWNGEYYHIRGWQKRSLLPSLYIKPTYAYYNPPLMTANGIDLYHELEQVSTLSEEITTRRRDNYGSWDISEDFLPAIPYKAGALNVAYGQEDAVSDFRFFSASGRRYRLHLSDGDALTASVEVPASGLSDSWDGLVDGGIFYEFYKVEEWSDVLTEWVVIGVKEWAMYWSINPGELEAIQEEWAEAGITNKYTEGFVSGSIIADGVKVIVFGRSRAGYGYGFNGFHDPDTRFKTKTDTSNWVSRVVGISGTLEGTSVSSFDDNGNSIADVYTAEGIMDGRSWLDETSGVKITGGMGYPLITDTNTEQSSKRAPSPWDLSGNAVIRFNAIGGAYGILGKVLATTEDKAPADIELVVGGDSRVRSATTVPPLIPNAGESAEVAYVRVTRQA
jgi:hypothetical protein